MNSRMTPKAHINDLVTIDGYANRIFRVNSYTHEFMFELGAEYEDIYYDCTCVTSDEYMLGSQHDVTVVCKADKATQFLSTFKHPVIEGIDIAECYESQMRQSEVNDMKQPIKPIKAETSKKDEPTREELVDVLLDEMNNVNNAIELIGDEDGHYAERLAEIKAELKEVTESAEGGR